MRKDMMETKVELEETVKVHKESVQKQRSVEIEIEVTVFYPATKMSLYI